MLTINPSIPEIKTINDAKNLIEQRGLSHVKVAVTDVDGIMRGKFMSREKFFSALEKGFGFCDVIFGWDSEDVIYDNGVFTNWNSGFPDLNYQIAIETARNLPLEKPALDNAANNQSASNVIFLAEAGNEKSAMVEPRTILKKILAKAEGMNLKVKAAVEFEFFLFHENPDSVRAKNYQDLKPVTPGSFGYSILRSGLMHEFYENLLTMCNNMRIPLEGLHTETGPGVLEAAITVADGLEAADRAVLFKSFAKILAQKMGLMACFMAKWSPHYPGQSGHIHISLQDKNDKPIFYDAKNEHNISGTMRHFIAGQQKLMPEVLAMIAPTVNSYTRFVPGYWAPTTATWGIENRTTGLRIIGNSEKSMRVEYRVAAADQNPYLALAAAIASGLYGIEHNLEPNPPITGNAYESEQVKKLPLPRTLGEAALAFKNSKAARTLFGDFFVDYYTATREFEQNQALKAITDWQLKRYFEII